jgi:hypothetical protein
MLRIKVFEVSSYLLMSKHLLVSLVSYEFDLVNAFFCKSRDLGDIIIVMNCEGFLFE